MTTEHTNRSEDIAIDRAVNVVQELIDAIGRLDGELEDAIQEKEDMQEELEGFKAEIESLKERIVELEAAK